MADVSGAHMVKEEVQTFVTILKQKPYETDTKAQQGDWTDWTDNG